jgi:hypothetical protein
MVSFGPRPGLLLPVALLGAFLVHTPTAFATASAPVTVGGSILSYGGSVALAGSGGFATGYGISKPNIWSFLGGVVAVAGALTIGVVDPSAATFYSGSVQFHYDPLLLEVHEIGWLGDWGVDPSKAAPPTDENLWDGITIFLQQPAPGLVVQTTNNPATGLADVTFDWGPDGKTAATPDPFNMLGIGFRVLRTSHITYLGDFASPPPGANLFVSSPTGVTCTVPEDPNTMRLCGEPTTSYFRIQEVPEPNAAPLLAAAALGLIGLRKKLRFR